MKISVIGAGYVGLTTAACLAQIGHDVFCGESDTEKLHKLKNSVMPLFEPHLEEVVDDTRRAGRLRFGSSEEAIDWGSGYLHLCRYSSAAQRGCGLVVHRKYCSLDRKACRGLPSRR